MRITDHSRTRALQYLILKVVEMRGGFARVYKLIVTIEKCGLCTISYSDLNETRYRSSLLGRRGPGVAELIERDLASLPLWYICDWEYTY